MVHPLNLSALCMKEMLLKFSSIYNKLVSFLGVINQFVNLKFVKILVIITKFKIRAIKHSKIIKDLFSYLMSRRIIARYFFFFKKPQNLKTQYLLNHNSDFYEMYVVGFVSARSIKLVVDMF